MRGKLKRLSFVDSHHHEDCQNFSILNFTQMKKDMLFLLDMFMMMLRQKQKLWMSTMRNVE